VLYDRGLPDGTELTFGNTSALHENDLVMFAWPFHGHTEWCSLAAKYPRWRASGGK
jgi:hypothetical protein